MSTSTACTGQYIFGKDKYTCPKKSECLRHRLWCKPTNLRWLSIIFAQDPCVYYIPTRKVDP